MFGAAAGGVAGAYFLTNDRDVRAWLPNVATALAVLAVTVSAVEWIVGEEARRRLQPRVESVMSDVRLRLSIFANNITTDYGETHLWTFRAQ